MSADNSMTSLLRELAAFVAVPGHAERHPAVAEKATLHWIDSVAAASATWQAEDRLAQKVTAALTRPGGTSAVIGHHPAAPVDAALINGVLIHGCDFDDSYYQRVVHAEAPVVGAVLALADSPEITGTSLLDAIAVGMEVSIRLALCCDGELSLFDSGFHNTALFGTFGAAAGAARLLGLDIDQTSHALSLCAGFAAGTGEGWNEGVTRIKPLQVGNAAAQGVTATLLARSGLEASAVSLFGERGFFEAHAGRTGWSVENLAKDLGQQWHLLDSGFKLYPAGAMVQASIECAIELRKALRDAGLGAEHIDEITLVVPQQYGPVIESLGERIYELRSAYQAFASWPYNVALALTAGDVVMADLTMARLTAEPVSGLARSMQVAADDEDHGHGPAYRPTTLRVRAQGTWYAASVEGHAGLASERPRDRLLHKYHTYADPCLGAERAEAVLEGITSLPHGSPHQWIERLSTGPAR